MLHIKLLFYFRKAICERPICQQGDANNGRLAESNTYQLTKEIISKTGQVLTGIIISKPAADRRLRTQFSTNQLPNYSV
jgi:hypothetical protein